MLHLPAALPRIRTMAIVAAAGGLLVSSGVVASAGVASADATTSISYPINGSTYIKATNSTMTLGPGTLAATVDLTTDTLTGSVTLPPATGSFTELGLIPVTATAEFIQDGQTTGTVDPSTGAIQATSQITLKLVDLKIAGLDTPIGDSCETTIPATVALASESGFSVLKGGTVTGTYTIPDFSHCLLATPLINLTIPGPGNTITLTLGQATAG
jgi:hypothetical protein